ncbi:MAG: 50S ribosomal protein L21 [Bdellovibrio sp.]|jgi:large subunit ribosomal protein L21
MYAIIRTGGKQYKVQAGDVIRVEKIENPLGTEFNLTDVLMVGGDSPVFGQPLVKNALVTVVVTKQTRHRKVIIFKKKRRQGYRRFKTHRQPFTELFVKAIALDGRSTKAEASATVIDVDQQRKDRITNRTVAKNAVKQERKSADPAEKAAGKVAKKKVAKKAAPKRATKKASSKNGAKKKAAKAAKKTSKKT